MVSGFIFFGFLLEERGGKIGDFVTVGMGSYWWCGWVHIVGKEIGGLGFHLGEKRGGRGMRNGGASGFGL